MSTPSGGEAIWSVPRFKSLLKSCFSSVDLGEPSSVEAEGLYRLSLNLRLGTVTPGFFDRTPTRDGIIRCSSDHVVCFGSVAAWHRSLPCSYRHPVRKKPLDRHRGRVRARPRRRPLASVSRVRAGPRRSGKIRPRGTASLATYLSRGAAVADYAPPPPAMPCAKRGRARSKLRRSILLNQLYTLLARVR